jgi:hypothetical protein
MVARGGRGTRDAGPALLALSYLQAEADVITAQSITTAMPATAQSWTDTANQIAAEGGGIWRLILVEPSAIDRLLDAARGGDAEALRLARILAHLSHRLDAFDSPCDAAPSCLLCESPFYDQRYPGALIVFCGECPEPDAALACGVCATCQNSQHSAQNLHTAIVAALSARFGIALRLLRPVHPVVGHA